MMLGLAEFDGEFSNATGAGSSGIPRISCVTLDRERFILPAAICTHPPLANDIQYTPQPGSGARRIMPCPLVSADAQCVDDVREERPPTYS